MLVEQFKQLFDDANMLSLSRKKATVVASGIFIHHAKLNKILERTPVIDLKLKVHILRLKSC